MTTTTRTRVVITDSDFGDDAIEREVLGEVAEVVTLQARTEQAVIAGCAGANALLVQWAPITDRVLDALPDIRIIVRYGIGLDNIDLATAAARGVEVRNVDDYCIDEVAGHAAAAIAAANRRLPAYDRATKAQQWGPAVAPVPRAPSDDPVGIAGYGRIGQRVASRLASAGHPIVVWDTFAEQRARADGHAIAPDLIRLARAVNHLTLHIPATPETSRIVGDDVLAALVPHGHVVNTARGSLVDEPAMLRWLDANPGALASLDVFASEPPSDISRALCAHAQVAASPHVAYLSADSLPRLRRTAAGHVRDALLQPV